jgi:hypothetical protein
VSDRIILHTHTLPSGRAVSFFLNLDTSLVVVDVISADETCGNEITRALADRVPLPNDNLTEETSR